MKFERIARELYLRPWAITPGVYGMFHDVFQNHLKSDAKTTIFGEEVEYDLPQEYENIDGVAVIKINGPLGHRLDKFTKACMGGVDYIDIREAIAKANADQSVTGIVLDINSPGGMVSGLHETAQHIAKSGKFVCGYTDTLAASAGYYLMAACRDLIASHSSETGCIGTLMTWVDVTKAYEMNGFKREMVASGKYKGMCYPGMTMTDEQRDLLQGEIDSLASEFRAFVSASRKNTVNSEAMQGQCFSGPRALKENLIDQIGSLEDAISTAKQER